MKEITLETKIADLLNDYENMKEILITRKLIKSSEKYASSIFDIKLNEEDKLLTKDELIDKSSDCDGILSSLTEKFDADIISKLSKKVKIISNFAVGFGNIDLDAAKKKNIVITGSHGKTTTTSLISNILCAAKPSLPPMIR